MTTYTPALVNSTQEAEMAHYVDSLDYPFCHDVSKYEKIVKVSCVCVVTSVWNRWLIYSDDFHYEL